jgi:outer membrane protein, heavy metal efflux system
MMQLRSAGTRWGHILPLSLAALVLAVAAAEAQVAPQPADGPPLPEPNSAADGWSQMMVRTEVPPPAAAERVPLGRRTPLPLVIPFDLPGSQTPPVVVPPMPRGTTEEARRAMIGKLYQPLPAVPAPVAIQPGPEGRPLSLPELEQIACAQNPVIRQAAADVQSAQGVAIQAGAYPNPHVGFEGDTIGTGATGGYQGANISQEISTGGKLHLARAAAEFDVQNAQLTLRRTQSEVATQVRSRYFAVLVALEKMRVNQALVEFTQNVYRVQIERVKVGEAAAYEPMQLSVLVLQAQALLIQAQHDYLSAWRQLASTLSAPAMPPTEIGGSVEQPPPPLTYQAVLQQILAHHTDLLAAHNSVARAQLQLRLARITPWVPNLDASVAVMKDYTVEPFGAVVNAQLGATIPLWDRNQGNILAAEGALARSRQECCRARDELVSSLADAYARFETNRMLVDYHRTAILPNQVRTYRGVYERYQQSPESVTFGDIVTAQQTLAQVVTAFVQAEADQWQAVVDIAGLMQVCNLSQLDEATMPAVATGPAAPLR